MKCIEISAISDGKEINQRVSMSEVGVSADDSERDIFEAVSAYVSEFFPSFSRITLVSVCEVIYEAS